MTAKRQPLVDEALPGEGIDSYPVRTYLSDAAMERFIEALEIDGRNRAEVLREIINKWSWATLKNARARVRKPTK